MDVARKTFVGLAWLFVLAVAIQFLLAGLGVLGGESIEAHRQWGFVVLHLIPILMLVAAIIGRMGRSVIGLTILLFLLVFLQPCLPTQSSTRSGCGRSTCSTRCSSSSSVVIWHSKRRGRSEAARSG
jgi:hypothetical protein